MKITLINPDSPFLLDQRVFPPLGLMRIYAVLKKQGHDVTFIDLNFGQLLDNIEAIINADYTMFSATSPQFPKAVKYMERIKKVWNDKAIFVIGGAHSTVDPESCMQFDYIIEGDGEYAFEEILRDQKSPIAKDWTPRIMTMKPIKDINKLTFPDRDCVRIHDYKYEIDGVPATSIVTSRGCPYECAFCCKMEKNVRLHSSKYVINEVKMLKERYGFSAIQFFDDLFILSRKRLESICAGLRGMGIKWRCFVRANLVTQKTFNMLARSGCREVGFGAESGSQKILDIINKKTTVEQNTKLIEMAHKAGVKVKAFLIVGLPGETWESVKETEDWIRRAKPDSYDVSILMPYPGSPVWEYTEKYDIKFDKKEIIDNIGESWYKGVPGKYSSFVSTKALSAADIIKARERLDKIKREY